MLQVIKFKLVIRWFCVYHSKLLTSRVVILCHFIFVLIILSFILSFRSLFRVKILESFENKVSKVSVLSASHSISPIKLNKATSNDESDN